MRTTSNNLMDDLQARFAADANILAGVCRQGASHCSGKGKVTVTWLEGTLTMSAEAELTPVEARRIAVEVQKVVAEKLDRNVGGSQGSRIGVEAVPTEDQQ